jgi:hypothetical protein
MPGYNFIPQPTLDRCVTFYQCPYAITDDLAHRGVST